VAAGNAGALLASADGITWTERNARTGQPLFGVVYGNGTFVAVGHNGAITQSDPVEGTPILFREDGRPSGSPDARPIGLPQWQPV
jgi:hypothetical protein